MKATILMLGGLLLFSPFATGQHKTNVTKKEVKAMRIEQAVNHRHLMISVNQAIPMGHPSINLTSDYWVRLKNDSVWVYLPYYGRAYSVPYNGGGGFDFKGIRKNDQITQKKKQGYTWQFSVQTTEDNYQFDIWISLDGYASVSVNSNNRQPISYYGEYTLPDKASIR